MSGNATITGRIGIYPPITWPELVAAGSAVGCTGDNFGLYCDARVAVTRDNIDTDQGVLSIRSGVAIIPGDGETNGYTLTEDINRIVHEFATAPDGTTRRFDGWLQLVWDDGFNVYRVHVVDGEVTKSRPTMTWPVGARDEDAPQVDA
jgi:hypothetical protein